MPNICVLGLGYIGLPTSIVFANSGYSVLGVDVRADIVDKLNKGHSTIKERGVEIALKHTLESGKLEFSTEIKTSDAYIITVQTPQRMGVRGTPVSDLTYVRSAVKDVSKVLMPGQLVILESTVPPKTTRMVQELLAETSGLSIDSFSVAHCPERVIPGKIMTELRENDRVIGADNPAALESASALYRRILSKGRILFTDSTTAELCKLAENTFRDVNIAYANELSVICARLGVNVFELIELANRHPRVNILRPGVGVGGHCIAVDPWFIHETLPDDAKLIRTARQINDAKPEFIADYIAKSSGSTNVCVLGLAYKPNVDDLRESPSLVLCKLLKEHKMHVRACEPFSCAPTIDGIQNIPLEEVLQNDDYLVLATPHKIFLEAHNELTKRKLYDCSGLLR